MPQRKSLVGGECVLHFLDLPRLAKHPFAGDDCGDLFQAQGVVLNGQRGVDSADPILPSEFRHVTRTSQGPDTARFTRNLRHQGQDGRGDGVGR